MSADGLICIDRCLFVISGVEGTATERLHQRRNEAAVRDETCGLVVSNFGLHHSHCCQSNDS